MIIASGDMYLKKKYQREKKKSFIYGENKILSPSFFIIKPTKIAAQKPPIGIMIFDER